MTTIGSLGWAIQAHTSGFTAGVVGTKKELADLRRAFESSLSPVQKYSMGIERLQELAAKFPSKAGVLHAAIARMRREMQDSSPSAQALTQVMGRMGLVMDPVSAAFKVFDLAIGAARTGMQALSNLISKVVAQMEKLDATAKKAQSLGITPGSLMGLQFAAQDISGIAPDQFDSGLTQLSKRIADSAITGKGDAASALGRLGLNAGALSGLAPDEQLLQIADAMDKVQNPSERLSLAFQILSKQGGEMATTLAAGRKEVLRLSEEGQKLLMVKFIDQGNITAAGDALFRLKTKWEGLLDVMGNEFAPLVKDIGNDLAAFGNNTKDAENFRDVIREIALDVAQLVDELTVLSEIGAFKKIGDFLSGTPLGIAGNITGKAGNITGKLVGGERDEFLKNPNRRVSKLQSAFTESDQLRKLMEESRPIGGGGRATIIPEAGETVDKLSDKIESLTERMKSQVETFGMGSDAAELYRLRLELATNQQLDATQKADAAMKIEAAAQQIRFKNFLEDKKKTEEAAQQAAEQAKKHRLAEVAKLQESLRSPSEKLRKDFEHLLEFRATLSPEAFQRGLTDLAAKTGVGVAAPEKQTIGAIRAGSIEALRAQFPGANVQERTLKQVEAQTNEAKAMKDLLREIRDQGKDGPVIKEAV